MKKSIISNEVEHLYQSYLDFLSLIQQSDIKNKFKFPKSITITTEHTSFYIKRQVIGIYPDDKQAIFGLCISNCSISEPYQKQGIFSAFLTKIENSLTLFNPLKFKLVMVEQVLNNDLYKHLENRGYRKNSNDKYDATLIKTF